MSSATMDRPVRNIDRSNIKRPGIVRLTRVEMRKMVDTRSGFWLLVTIGLLSLLIVAVILIWGGEEGGRTFYDFFQPTLFPVAIFLPVLGILMVTSEFSQRTTLATFALVPHRGRVMAAKFAAGIIYALLSVVTSLVAAAIGHGLALAFGQTSTADWSIEGTALGGAVLIQALGVINGIAFGLLLMNTPAAIVLNFVAPIALTIIASVITGLTKVLAWIDITAATDPLTTNSMTSTDWQHLGTASLFWIVLPIVLGSSRLAKRELK